MHQKINSEHWTDSCGKPAGGCTYGVGFTISWQNGPLGPEDVHGHQREPNGAFVEAIIAAARDRIEWYQDSDFECEENADALNSLDQALKFLQRRTVRRRKEGVEGTHEGS